MSLIRLEDTIRACKSPLALHIAPSVEQIPSRIRSQFRSMLGDIPQAQTESLRMYCRDLLEAAEGQIGAAVFEASAFLRYGYIGLEVLDSVLTVAKNKGFYTILNAACSDPTAWFSGFSADAVTVSPYGGSSVMRAGDDEHSVFVLLRSAGAEASEVQGLMAGDRRLYEAVGELAVRAGRGSEDARGYSAVGAVVGGDSPLDIRELRRRMEHTFLLLFGCSMESAVYAFDDYGGGALLLIEPPVAGEGEEHCAVVKESVEKAKKEMKKFVTVV